MKRIAGTFALVAGLSGCVSFTAQPGANDKKAADAKSAAVAAAPNYALAPPPSVAAPNHAAWGAHPGHQVLPDGRVATNYSPLPTPPPQQRLAPTPPPPLAASPALPQQNYAPATNNVAMNTPAVPTGNSQPPGQLQLPAGMLAAVTPPAERQVAERQVSYTVNTPGPEPILPPSRVEPKQTPRPMPQLPAPVVRNSAPAEPRPAPAPAAVVRGGAPLMRLVNTKRITLNFEVKDVGPSGLSSVELWYTQDCREWKKYDAPTQAQAYVIEVDEEGMYGFTLLAKSGIGLGKEPPAIGEQPQVWVIVDLSKPDVQLTEVTPTTQGRTVQVSLGWRASDKNLGRQPISLYYAEKAEGPWKVIAANLENTGKHVWQAPTGLARVHFKVEASDLAGNIGRAMSGKPVLLDNSMPTVSITNVDSAPVN